MYDALAKVIPHMDKSRGGTPDMRVIMRAIADTRAKWAKPVLPPMPSQPGDTLSK